MNKFRDMVETLSDAENLSDWTFVWGEHGELTFTVATDQGPEETKHAKWYLLGAIKALSYICDDIGTVDNEYTFGEIEELENGYTFHIDKV